MGYSESSKKDLISGKLESAACQLALPPQDAADVVSETWRNCFLRLPPRAAGSEMEFLIPGKNKDSPSRSYKPHNWILNWKKLFHTVPTTVVAAAGAAAMPWLWPFAALLILRELKEQFEICVSYVHGVVMQALWAHSETTWIERSKGLDLTNSALQDAGHEPLDSLRFDAIIDELASLECVETRGGGAFIIVTESVVFGVGDHH